MKITDEKGNVDGDDYMGGTAANRLSLAQSQGVYGNLGSAGGEQGHQITTPELASHAHGPSTGFSYIVNTAGGAILQGSGSGLTTASSLSVGSDTAHNNIQPTLIVNHIIKT